MNKILIIGRNVKDIEVKGDNVGRFSLAVNRNYKNQDGEYETDFINCISFGKTTELLQKYTSKGSKLAVEGRIQTGSYEKEGTKVYTTDVIVERVEFLDSKQKETPKEEKQSDDVFESFGKQVEKDLDLPF